MLINTGIALHRLVLSLSEALDWVCPDPPDSRQRATYIAVRLAGQMGIPADEMQDLFLAAALPKPVLEGLNRSLLREVRRDGPRRAETVDAEDLLGEVAWIARCYRTRWNQGRGDELDGRPVPPAGRILNLAETVGRLVDRNFPVLAQAESIIKQVVANSGSMFCEECVDAFRQLAGIEAFWLDCVSGRLHGLIAGRIHWKDLSPSHPVIRHIARVFGQMVDSLSQWTAGHSAQVAATSAELAALMSFHPGKQAAMRLAGWLHDLGKLSVPAHVLDKADRLSRQEWVVVRGHPYYTYQILHSTGAPAQITEWASFHHERVDGKGYPFGLGGADLSPGARIMAVADAYTAVMQDRAYRPGIDPAKAVAMLDCMAGNGALDGEVVAMLIRHRDRIERHRLAEQAAAVGDPVRAT